MPHTPRNDLSNSTSAKSIAFKYVLSCSAAMVAETVTYPLDITKTRLQTHAVPGIIKKQSGMLRVTYNIGKKHISKIS
jgi:solute carrier family 25 uncoupling protein 27